MTDDTDETADADDADSPTDETGTSRVTDAKDLQRRLDDLGEEIEDAKRAADELARDSGLLSDTDAATYYETISGQQGEEDEQIAPG